MTAFSIPFIREFDVKLFDFMLLKASPCSLQFRSVGPVLALGRYTVENIMTILIGVLCSTTVGFHAPVRLLFIKLFSSQEPKSRLFRVQRL